MLRVLFITAMALSASAAQAYDQYVDVQSGSLLGLVHVSYGAEFSQHHNVLVGVGYVPKLSYHREMALYSLRYRYDQHAAWDVSGMKLEPFNFGVGFLIGDHDDLFLQLPSKYPSGYYAPSALRIVFNYQANLYITQTLSAYFDMSILDVGFIGYIREPGFYNDNYEFLGLEGITNWGVGVRYAF